MELSQDIGHRPMVLLRFNPDAYDNEPSCWKINGFGTCSVTDTTTWTKRLQTLKEQITYWLTHRTTKTVECIQLYFSAHDAI
jgi:hypothetical protein